MVPPYHHLLCFNNPPHPPAPSVIILQSSKLRRLFSLANLLKGPFFSQNYTEEQNSQRPTETLSQPMTQSVTANVDTNKEVTSSLHPPHMGISVITPLPFGGGDGGGGQLFSACSPR